MKYVKLGSSDIDVSPICLGTWQFNGGQMSADKTWQAQPEQVSRSILDKAIELGVNYLDTAEAYLNSESVVGRLIEGRRQNLVLATKFGRPNMKFNAEDVEKSLTASLQRLQTDYIDLYQVHWPSFVGDYQQVFDELRRQQAKGRIRQYGVCNFGPANLEKAFSVGGKPVTNQVSYSLLWRAVEYDILPVCEQRSIGVLPYSPLQQGLLSGKYLKLEDVPEGRRRTRLFNSKSTSLSVHGGEGAEKQMFQAIHDIKAASEAAGIDMPVTSLSWLTAKKSVTSVIVGASSPEQLEQNAKLVTLEQEFVDKLDAVTRDLKEHFGKSPDLWANRIE